VRSDPSTVEIGGRTPPVLDLYSAVPDLYRDCPGSVHGSARMPRPSLSVMLRPASCVWPAGVSPVPVGTGAPGSGPRFVVERWRAERGVESLFGGSNHAGRSVKRTLQPRQRYSEEAEPLMSRRRPCPAGPVPGSACGVPPGYGRRHVWRVGHGTGEARLHAPGVGQETGRISRW